MDTFWSQFVSQNSIVYLSHCFRKGSVTTTMSRYESLDSHLMGSCQSILIGKDYEFIKY